MMVQTASHFTSTIMVEKNGLEVNGKSIMGLLLLAAAQGTLVTVRAMGEDAHDAVEALGNLIDAKFGEG